MNLVQSLNNLLVNHKAELHLKEIPNQASCLPVSNYLPINKITASRLFILKVLRMIS